MAKKKSKAKPAKKAKSKPAKKKAAKKAAPKKKVAAKKVKAKPVKAKAKKAQVKKPAKKVVKKAAKKAVKKVVPQKAAKPVKPATKKLIKPVAKGIPVKEVIIDRSLVAPVKPQPKPQPPSPVLKKIKKEPTEPVEPVEPLPKVVKTFSLKSETKGKSTPPHPNQYSIEYVMHASASLLFEVISSPSGLSEWFADDVNIRDGNFTFFWDGSTQVAKQIAYKQDKLVRFQWEGKPDYTFFEFRIETDDLTNDTSLIITDFAEDGDKESARLLWDNQINKLRKSIGS